MQFGGQAVRAVPYDTPVIGYGMKTVNTLRLWQAEPFQAFDFNLFNAQKYAAAVRERDAAEDISRVLYPNDDTDAGKRLRLKQQYFFSSASLQDMVRAYRAAHGGDFTHFADAYAVQLNDTHPTVAIPELLRLLVEEAGMRFADAVRGGPRYLCLHQPHHYARGAGKMGVRSCSAACCPGCIRM